MILKYQSYLLHKYEARKKAPPSSSHKETLKFEVLQEAYMHMLITHINKFYTSSSPHKKIGITSIK